MRTANDIRTMLEQINTDCAKCGESVVPVTHDNADYYSNQLEALGFTDEEIANFIATL